MIETVEEWRQARCDFVIRREPARLSDLAYWVHDTAGPVELMDASLSSLQDLWRWYVGFVFAGCPGVPERARPEEFQWYVPNEANDQLRFAGDPGLHWRALFAAESLNHYVMRALRRLDSSARWEVFVEPKSKRPGVVTGLAGQIGIRTPGLGDGFSWPAANIMTAHVLEAQVARHAGGDDIAIRFEDWLDPARFEFMNTRWFPEGLLPEVQAREDSVLQPFLEVPQVPWNSPEREQPPMYTSRPTSAAGAPEHVKWAIHGRLPRLLESSGVELMSLYPVLTVDKVAAGMAALGFTDGEGRPITITALTDEGTGSHPTLGVQVEAFFHDGSLRELTVDGGVPRTEYQQLKRSFQKFAKGIKAELTEGY